MVKTVMQKMKDNIARYARNGNKVMEAKHAAKLEAYRAQGKARCERHEAKAKADNSTGGRRRRRSRKSYVQDRPPKEPFYVYTSWPR